MIPELAPARLKVGDVLHLRGTGAAGQMMSYQLPLADFAKANEGPPQRYSHFRSN